MSIIPGCWTALAVLGDGTMPGKSLTGAEGWDPYSIRGPICRGVSDEALCVTGGHRDVGVARQEVVRILRMGYTDTMPTKWLVLLTGRSSRELQPDAERDETKAKLMPSQAWQACSQHVTSLYTCSRALPVTLLPSLSVSLLATHRQVDKDQQTQRAERSQHAERTSSGQG